MRNGITKGSVTHPRTERRSREPEPRHHAPRTARRIAVVLLSKGCVIWVDRPLGHYGPALVNVVAKLG
jgi:hypothetical protein